MSIFSFLVRNTQRKKGLKYHDTLCKRLSSKLKSLGSRIVRQVCHTLAGNRTIFNPKSTVFKNQKKSHSKNLKLAVKQCYQNFDVNVARFARNFENWWKMPKLYKSKWDILGDFQPLCRRQKLVTQFPRRVVKSTNLFSGLFWFLLIWQDQSIHE